MPETKVTVLASINHLCSELAVYGVTKTFHIWLPQRMFTQILIDLKDRLIENKIYEIGQFDPYETAKEDKFAYQDPFGFTYVFQKASLLMITAE